MRFFSVLFAGGVVASLCLTSFAQTADFGTPAPQPQASPAQQQQTAPAAPQQTPVAPLKLENLPPDPHTPTPEERAAEEATQIRAQIMRLAQSQANWGPKVSSA